MTLQTEKGAEFDLDSCEDKDDMNKEPFAALFLFQHQIVVAVSHGALFALSVHTIQAVFKARN